MTKSEQMRTIIEAAKIRVSHVSVLGRYVHVDTWATYEVELVDFMTSAGIKCHSKSEGRHMDNYVGFRMVFVI